MQEKQLFKSKGGQWVSTHTLLNKLEEVGAADTEILYIHTALSFGIPNSKLTKIELLETLLDLFLELKVPTICFPTYTFSFCNGEEYNVTKTKTKMGALNEYARKQNIAYRSVDPLMSNIVIVKDLDLVKNIGHDSIGTDSTFDKFRNKEGVKFLFFGSELPECFTYMHYLEKVAKVPYRYDRDFSGKIISEDKSYEDTYTLFVRYHNVEAGKGSYAYEKVLLEKERLKKTSCGDSFISCIEEPDAYEIFLDLLKQDSNIFLTHSFDPNNLDTTFDVQNMVAL